MYRILSLSLVSCFCLFSAGSLLAQKGHHQKEEQLAAKPGLVRLIDANLRQACNQYKILMGRVPPDRLPKTWYANTDRTETSDAGWWTSGFFSGTLLYLYEYSHDTSLSNEALRKMRLLEKEQFNKGTHDLGFMMYCSFGNALRLSNEGLLPPASYDTVLLNSARSLSTRFNPRVGCIKSWDGGKWNFPVIIDNMMNLELLCWATHASWDSSFYRIAVSHANTTLRNHFRPDHSSFHVVDYDSATGAVIAKRTAQGFADSSAWARGQSWGLYGYTMMYRCTHDPAYLEQAERIAAFLMPHPHLAVDRIPYWDYDAPGIPRGNTPVAWINRDASAAAIMASALIELSHYSGAEKGRAYLDRAEEILVSLSDNAYKAVVGSNGGFLLKHSVGNLPGRTEIDVPLTYADYYFVEAMLRYKQLAGGKSAATETPIPPHTTSTLAPPTPTAATPARARLVNVAKGWAGNSVNAVVFRHNSLVTFKDTQFIAYYDAGGSMVLGKRRSGDTSWQLHATQYKGNTADAHNMISMMVDGEGFLHVSWDHHNNPLNYCRSIAPRSLELGEKMPMTGLHEQKVTYPEFYRMPDGDLLFLYRDGASGNGNLVLDHYDPETRRWTQVQNDLIDGEGRRNAYWQACADRKGVFHLSWTWRESPDVSTNHDICYARSRDGGRSWERTDGAKYALPIKAATAEYAWPVPQHSELINQTSMCADEEGHPYIATYWRTAGSNIPQYRLVWFDGTRWDQDSLSQRSSPFSLSGVGTKKIPISRPQLLLSGQGHQRKAFLVFRDIERGDRASIAICQNFPAGKWQTKDLASEALDAWEPSYDTELWKSKEELDLFVEKLEQGDGERTVAAAPQMIRVLEWKPE